MNFDQMVDRAIDKIFSMKKSSLYVILIFVFTFILRSMAAIRSPFSADEMVHGTHAFGFIGSGKLQIMDQSAVWFWLVDFFTNVLGSGVFGIRFASILFGSLTVVAIYLIGKEMFNSKVGLIAALVAAVSPFQLNQVAAVMDPTMTFFVFLSIYFFALSVNREQKKWFWLIWIAMGVAVMTKPIALTFLAPMLLVSFYYHYKRKKSVKIKDYIYVGILLLVMFLPVLTFNYLLYKDAGIVDLQFARFTKISFETYQGIESTIQGFNFKGLVTGEGNGGTPMIISGFSILYDGINGESLVLLLFSLIGLVYLFIDKNRFALLLLATFAVPFIFLSGTSLLGNHFVFASFYASLLGAFGIYRVSGFAKKHYKIFIYIFVLGVLATSFIKLENSRVDGLIGSKSPMDQLIDYKEANIAGNSLVVADSRIYRGRIVFMLWDTNYLEANFLSQALNAQTEMPGAPVPTDLYYVECVPDDCGWGTVKDQPDFNRSMEDITGFIASQASVVKEIDDTQGNPHFRVYKTTTQLNPGVIDIAKSTHDWFYYPVAYEPKERIFDNYETNNVFDSLLDNIAHIILYIEVLLSIVLGAFVFYHLSE